MWRKTDRYAGAAGALLFIAAWYAMTSSALFGSEYTNNFSPVSTVIALWNLVTSGEIFPHAAASLRRIGIGLAVASLFGIPVGLLTGYFRLADRITYPTFQFIRIISPLAWMPLAITVFGIGDKPVYFLVSIAAVWPLVINTSFGVKSLDEIWMKVASIYHIKGIRFVREVLVPAVLPDMLTGLRLALGISWIVLVPAEMLGVSKGLGYYILDTRDRFAYGELIAVIIIIGIFGYITDYSIKLLEKKLSWAYREEGE